MGSLALLAATFPSMAAAKPAQKPITGKLSRPGYTVIALAANGKATSVVATHRKFRLRPPAKRVTLQLRAKDGTYAGPIVIGGKGKRAIVGVRAAARLGKVKVKAKGYAKLARALPRKWVDAKRWARARKGVPIGAGRFGRVRSRHTHGGVPGDADLDGIPDQLDVDDDGDLILDDLDRSGAARASQVVERFDISASLTLALDQTVNANPRKPSGAPVFSDQQIEAGLAGGTLSLTVLPGDSAELDCGGLVYCSLGGTGKVFLPGGPVTGSPFPECCDPDGDGFGTLMPSGPGAGGVGIAPMMLHHGATSRQIGTGDVLIERVITGGVESQFPAALQYVFGTVPAVVSYDDGHGGSAAVSYPVASSSPGPPPMPSGPGTQENPFPVSAPGGEDILVKLTYWRPQRRPIAGEQCPPPQGHLCDPNTGWIDIGGLNYTPDVVVPSHLPVACPPDAFSEQDPNLTLSTFMGAPGAPSLPDLVDGAPDQPANPSNTFTFTLDLSRCLASQGLAFAPGDTVGVEVGANAPVGPGAATQNVWFKR